MVRKWFSYVTPFLLIVLAVFLLLSGTIEFKQLEEEEDQNASGDGDDLIFTLAEVAALPPIFHQIFLPNIPTQYFHPIFLPYIPTLYSYPIFSPNTSTSYSTQYFHPIFPPSIPTQQIHSIFYPKISTQYFHPKFPGGCPASNIPTLSLLHTPTSS